MIAYFKCDVYLGLITYEPAPRKERQVLSIPYSNVADKYINKLARQNGIKSRGRDRVDVIEDLLQQGHKGKLDHLASNFQYVGKYLTLCKTEQPFPDIANTAQKFLRKLVDERRINESQIDNEWRPTLSLDIQLCAARRDGGTVYLKLVEGKKTTIPSPDGYGSRPSIYPKFTVIIVHFNNEDPIIELRCATSEQEKYMNFAMELIGFGKPYKWHKTPKLTKEIVSKLYEVLRAGVAARHISIPTGLGGIQMYGQKGVDLDHDDTYTAVIDAFTKLNIPTDDTMDETCYFSYSDPVSGLEYEASVCIDIRNSFFTFNSRVPDFIVKHVMEGIWAVIIELERNSITQAAAGDE